MKIAQLEKQVATLQGDLRTYVEACKEAKLKNDNLEGQLRAERDGTSLRREGYTLDCEKKNGEISRLRAHVSDSQQKDEEISKLRGVIDQRDQELSRLRGILQDHPDCESQLELKDILLAGKDNELAWYNAEISKLPGVSVVWKRDAYREWSKSIESETSRTT